MVNQPTSLRLEERTLKTPVWTSICSSSSELKQTEGPWSRSRLIASTAAPSWTPGLDLSLLPLQRASADWGRTPVCVTRRLRQTEDGCLLKHRLLKHFWLGSEGTVSPPITLHLCQTDGNLLLEALQHVLKWVRDRLLSVETVSSRPSPGGHRNRHIPTHAEKQMRKTHFFHHKCNLLSLTI